jgi:hypothetical protein
MLNGWARRDQAAACQTLLFNRPCHGITGCLCSNGDHVCAEVEHRPWGGRCDRFVGSALVARAAVVVGASCPWLTSAAARPPDWHVACCIPARIRVTGSLEGQPSGEAVELCRLSEWSGRMRPGQPEDCRRPSFSSVPRRRACVAEPASCCPTNVAVLDPFLRASMQEAPKWPRALLGVTVIHIARRRGAGAGP